jgi:MATE family multidrug resistance protein
MAALKSLDYKIWGIAWPAILANLSVPLLGLVDAAILGHLDSSRYLGAVALGAALLSFLYWGFGFLRMGTTGRVARALGAGSQARAERELGRAMWLALGLALAVWLAHPLWLDLGFALMAPDAELLPLAKEYTAIRIASAPAVLVTYAVVGWCIGRQDTRWPLAILLLTNLSNILLDFLLILGLGLASKGAALATLLAEYLGCGMALWVVQRQVPGWRREFPALLREPRDFLPLLHANRHLFLRTICLLGALAFFTAMGEKFGAATLAANALLMQLVMVTAYAMDGFAFAAEGLAGQRAGAGDNPGFTAAVERCALWCLATAAAMSLLFLLTGPWLFRQLTDLPAVLALLHHYGPWLILLPLVSAPAYLFDGIFIGTACTRDLMRSMLVSVGLVYLPTWYLTRDWGNSGLWLAFTLFSAARGFTLYRRFRRRQSAEGWDPAGNRR